MIKFLGDEQDQITFVTRAVRVVDLITNLDMAAFQSHSGLSIFIYRLEVRPLPPPPCCRGGFGVPPGPFGVLRLCPPPHPQHEVDLCRRECPFVIKPKVQRPPAAALPEGEDMETDMEGEQRGGIRGAPRPTASPSPLRRRRPPPPAVTDVAMESSPGPSSAEARPDPAPPAPPAVPSTSAATPSPRGGRCPPGAGGHGGDTGDTVGGGLPLRVPPTPPGVQCIPQRAALLKSMLNFLKKAIQDPAFSDGIRHGGCSPMSPNPSPQTNPWGGSGGGTDPPGVPQ